MRKSKIFFIITAVFLISTIICICIVNNMTNEFDNNVWKKDCNAEYKAETEYKMTGDRTKLNELQKEKEEMSKLEHKRDTTFVISIIVGGMTIASLATGIVLTVVEKKKNKNKVQ